MTDINVLKIQELRSKNKYILAAANFKLKQLFLPVLLMLLYIQLIGWSIVVSGHVKVS